MAERHVHPVIADLLGPQFRLRVTATCMLGVEYSDAVWQRRRIQAVMCEVARTLARDGVKVEFVVGAPRSPELLRVSLEELADWVAPQQVPEVA